MLVAAKSFGLQNTYSDTVTVSVFNCSENHLLKAGIA